MDASSEFISTDKRDSVGIITLKRSRALNSLNLEMLKDLALIFDRWKNDASISAILLQGEGKAFCAGGDIKQLCEAAKRKDFETTLSFFQTEYTLDYNIWKYPKPIISILNGVVMGGGVGISAGNKFRIATDSTVWAMPETAIGFFTDVLASYFLTHSSHINLAMAIYITLTGARLNGLECVYTGLASHFVPQSQLEEAIRRIYASQLDDIPGAITFTSLPSDANIPIRSQRQMIEQIFSASSVEDIFANLARAIRDHPDQTWFSSTLEKLKQMSPTSLKVVFEQIMRGSTMDLESVHAMETSIAQHFMTTSDFVEGVRAVVIDKDHKPRWNPPSIEQVTKEQVLKFFEFPAKTVISKI
eukprot:TRINITY_DN10604_c0_g1_i1.p1 TRINITY_DN10604_c0_g1~~TRINITY_DN10604_c0_g1_i1.p1  ORF type:complete len:359 (-),score=90.03 TRINITY_DN10604_c0_g1_i1:103-1179(-)